MKMEAKHLVWGVVLLQAFLFVVKANATRASPSPLAVGLKGYRRFHANDSYIGQSIPCTYEEKLCFRYNTLYLPKSGRCLRLEHDMCEFVGDRQEFLQGSGHLFAVCPGYKDPCFMGKYRMAFDGRCYRKQMVREVLCGCAAEPTPHFLGGVECRCSPARPIHVQQPRKSGRCRIPDLRFPDNTRSFLYEDPKALPDLEMQCSAAQAKCFSKKMVTVRGKGRRCYSLHERGPCPPEHVVALDRKAALASRVDGTCVHVRGGCPRGQKRIAFDGRCHKDRDMKVLAYGDVMMTEDGRLIIREMGSPTTFELKTRLYPKNGSIRQCLLYHLEKGMYGPIHYGNPPCGLDNIGGCRLYEVEDELPLPDLD